MAAACSLHVGEVYPQRRCFDCDSAGVGTADAIDLAENRRLSALIRNSGYIPGSECPQHPNYPLLSITPQRCDRCKRDLERSTVAI